MTDDAPPPAVAPKLDPETLALRARPRRAIRFRRGVIVAIAATGSAGLVAVTWMALEPTVFRPGARQEEPAQPAGTAVPDTLAALPASYGDVPKLGPPLPGDLGRPILDRQRQLAGTAMVSGSDAATQAAAERERALAARKAARESALLVSLARGDTAPGTQAAPAVAASDPARRAPGTPELDPANDGNAGSTRSGSLPHRTRRAPSTRTRSRRRRRLMCCRPGVSLRRACSRGCDPTCRDWSRRR